MLQFMNVFGTIFQIALFQVLLVGGSFYWKFFFFRIAIIRDLQLSLPWQICSICARLGFFMGGLVYFGELKKEGTS